jgi:hypothetical protein
MLQSRRTGPLGPCTACDEVLVPGDTAACATRERRATADVHRQCAPPLAAYVPAIEARGHQRAATAARESPGTLPSRVLYASHAEAVTPLLTICSAQTATSGIHHESRPPLIGEHNAIYSVCLYRQHLSQPDRGICAQSQARSQLTDPGELCGNCSPPATDASRRARLSGATRCGSLAASTAQGVRRALTRIGSHHRHEHGSSSHSRRHLSVFAPLFFNEVCHEKSDPLLEVWKAAPTWETVPTVKIRGQLWQQIPLIGYGFRTKVPQVVRRVADGELGLQGRFRR